LAEPASQRRQSDLKINFLSRYLVTINQSRYGERFQRAISSACDQLEQIKKIMEKIDANMLSVPENIELYNQNNKLWLDVIRLTAELATNPEINLLHSSYLNFMSGKEFAGIERA